jgi:hypothetical protein
MSARVCRICGCTELNACIHPDGTPCAWVDDELCRRCDELMHTTALADIAAERARQIQQEGWTPEHDDEHDKAELATAAAIYAAPDLKQVRRLSNIVGGSEHSSIAIIDPWPWHSVSILDNCELSTRIWFKPSERRRDLVKAGALILAEIDRLDRLSAKAGGK